MFRMEWNSWEKVGRCKYKVAKKKLVDNRNRNVDEFLWLTFLRTQIVYGTRLSLTFAYKCRIDDAKTVKCFESLEIHSLHFLQKQNRIQMHSFTGSNEKQFYCDTPCASVHKFTNGSVTFTVKWHTKINRPEEKEEEHRRRWKGVENKTHFDVLTHVLLRLSSKHNWIGYIRSCTLDSHKGSSSGSSGNGSDDINIARTSSYVSHTRMYMASHQYGCEGIKTAFKHTSMHKRSLERTAVW